MFNRRTAAAIALVALTTFPRAASAQMPPACTAEQTEAWARAAQALGVATRDQSETLSNTRAKRFDIFRNWYPLDGSKQTVCGVLDRWTLYNGSPFTRGELDLHPHIIPGQPFEWIVQDVPNQSQVSLETCNGAPCIWGEVTAPDAFTKWFLELKDLGSLPTGNCDCDTTPACCSTAYKGNPVCGFGPFVAERAHGWRPEIHPVERIWAATTRNGVQVTDLLVIQDSSRRFGERSDFVHGEQLSTWRPWAPEKLDAEVGLAYAMQAGQTVDFALTRRFDAGTPGPFDPSAKRFDVAGGEVRINAPAWMRARHEACTVEGKLVRGFVWLTVPLKRNDGNAARAEGGALAVEILRTGGLDFPVEPLRTPARFSERAERQRQQRRSERSAETGQPRLVLDIVKVEAVGRSGTDATLPGVREYWGIPSGDKTVQDWHAVDRHAVWGIVRYDGEGQAAETQAEALNRDLEAGKSGPIEVTWNFEPAVLDNPPPSGAVTIGSSAQFFRYGIEMYGAERIKTTPNSLLDPPRPIRGSRPIVGPRAGVLTRIFIQVPRRAHDLHSPVAINLAISAQLRDAGGRTGSFSYQLPTHMPDVAGAGLQANVLSPKLQKMLARWILVQRGLKLSEGQVLDQMKTDWKLDFTSPSERRQPSRSRTTRLFGLAATEDGDLAPDELQELLRLALSYSAVRWP
jgi:hypothetical protein